MEIQDSDIQEFLSLIESISIADWDLFRYLGFNATTKTVNLISGYAAAISESLTIYADNDRQIQVTTALLALKDALNAYLASYDQFDKPEDISGLRLDINKAYQLDVELIKRL